MKMGKNLLSKIMLLLACILVGGSAWADEYNLYSGALTEGDYIIYYDGKAMKNTIASNRLSFEEVTPANDAISTTDASIVWHIAASGDYWTLYNAAESKYAASTGSKNQAGIIEDGTDDKSLWTVTGTSTYEFINKANAANKINSNLRNNGTYGFACYSTSTGGALTLYKKVSAVTSPLASIAVDVTRATTVFHVGDTFTYEGAVVIATYKNESTKDVTANATFSTPDMTTAGTKTVNVSYTENGETKTESYDITVNAPATLTSITLTGTYKTEYQQGDEFTAEGIIVTANYDDTTTEDVTTEATFTGYDMAAVGQQTVTVTYNNKTATYTITVNEVPSHNVTWYINGTPTVNSYKEGAAIDIPTPEDISGKTFVGWTANAITGSTDKAPEFVTPATTMGNEDVTYYAVFATKETSGSEPINDVLDRDKTEVTGTSYSNWSNKTDTSDAIYAGNSAGGNSAIQMRSNNNNSGIVTTTSGGKVSKVVVTWNENTQSGRTINIYGSNTAYTGAADLYDTDKQGKLLGTIVCGTSTELTVEGEYAFIGIRSASGALYLNDITITWGNGTTTISGYCTTVAADTRDEAGISFDEAAITKEIFESYTGQALTNPNNISPITWTSSNENVATVEDGTVTVKAVGVTTITAKFNGDDNFKPATVSYTLTIQDSRKAITPEFAETLINVNKEEKVNAPALSGNTGNATVTYASDNTEIATVDAETGEVTGIAEGTTTITATIAATDEYQGGTATFTVKVVDPNKPGTSEAHPYTVAEARAAIDAGEGITGVYATGIVSEIVTALNTQWGNITYNISADGTTTSDQLQAYRGKNKNGDFFTSENDIQVGDVVVIYGNLKKYNATYEFDQNNQLVSLNRVEKADPELAFEDAEEIYEVMPGDDDFTAPVLDNPHELTVTFATTDAEIAAVDAETGAVTIGSKEGTATITATFAGNDEYKAGSASYSIKVSKLNPELNITTASVEMNADTEADITEYFTVASEYDGEISFESTDETIATVENGTLKALAVGTATITISVGSDNYSAVTGTIKVTVKTNASVQPFNPGAGGYVLVTDASTLNAGDQIIIVGDGVAMSTEQKTNNRGETEVEVTGDKIASITEDVQVITLEGVTDAWYFNVGNGYLYAASSDKNYLKTEEEKDDNAKAIISIENNVASITFQGTNSRNVLQYNATSSLFSCYGSASQKDVYIYRLGGSSTLTIGASGYRTLVASKNVKFPKEVSAYIITTVNDEEAVLTKVKEAIPANEPFIVKADQGSYEVEVAENDECADVTGNLLKVSTDETTNGVYVLANKNNAVGFYKWNGGLLGAGRVYLELPAGAREFIGFRFEGETTGINALTEGQTANNKTVYNLNGQRVTTPTKGLYIIRSAEGGLQGKNGKKVIIK